MWKYTCLKKPNYTKGFQHHVHQFSNVSLWLLVECRLLRKPWQVLGATEDGSLSAVMSKKRLDVTFLPYTLFCNSMWQNQSRFDRCDQIKKSFGKLNLNFLQQNSNSIFSIILTKEFLRVSLKDLHNVHFNSLTFTIPV